MSKWKRLSRERVFDHKYFKVDKDIVELPGGQKIEWLFWNSTDSAMVVPLTADDELVMIRQYRYLPNQIALEFPSGHGDEGESMEDCARRELEEETGYQCKKLIKLGSFHETMSQLTRKIHIYLGEDAIKMDRPLRKQDENEEIEAVLVDLDDAVKMVKEGKVISMGTSLAIMLTKGRKCRSCQK